MRKFLLLFAALTAYCSASALELTFWNGNTKITSGQTVEFTDIIVDDWGTYKEVTMKPALYISSDIYTSKVSISATCTSGQKIQLCAGGTCMGGESVTKENVTVRTNTKLELGFDYITELDLDEAIPTVTTLIEAEDVTKADSKISFVIVMGEKGASVDEITVNENLYAVEGAIAYKTDAPCTLTLTNLAGINIYSETVAGEGTVNVPAGLYVYTFGSTTGKVYVK